MITTRINQSIGGIFLIVGTTLGAGMLTLPILSLGMGLFCSVAVLILLWVLMLYGALLILETHLAFPNDSGFSTLSKETLGSVGQYAAHFCMLSLFYCLTVAYISGGAEFLTQCGYFSFPMNAVLWTLILCIVVCWHIAAVDWLNRVLLTIKVCIFFYLLWIFMPYTQATALTHFHPKMHSLWSAVPVFFTAFGFHGSIPSINKYIGPIPKILVRVMIIGSAVPLFLYILWDVVALGILQHRVSMDVSWTCALTYLGQVTHKPIVLNGIFLFTGIAMTTSFLGVTLGLFDFFIDCFKKWKRPFRSPIAALCTFFPPLIAVLCVPELFIAALGYAAIPLAFLSVVLPVLMVRHIRKNAIFTTYRAPGGSLALWIAFFLGVSVIVLQTLTATKLLQR